MRNDNIRSISKKPIEFLDRYPIILLTDYRHFITCFIEEVKLRWICYHQNMKAFYADLDTR